MHAAPLGAQMPQLALQQYVPAAMLETVGSPVIELPAQPTLTEVHTGGLRACALREDDVVLCANAASFTPDFAPVEGLAP